MIRKMQFVTKGNYAWFVTKKLEEAGRSRSLLLEAKSKKQRFLTLDARILMLDARILLIF
jgi:hypothetical protein